MKSTYGLWVSRSLAGAQSCREGLKPDPYRDPAFTRSLLQSVVKSIRDLIFSRGPSVARQPHLPRKQALAQQPAHELYQELIIRGV